MKYGLALVAEFDREHVGISLSGECVTHAMSLRDTETKTYVGTFWFESDADRSVCLSYADALSGAMCTLYGLAPDGAQVRRYS